MNNKFDPDSFEFNSNDFESPVSESPMKDTSSIKTGKRKNSYKSPGKQKKSVKKEDTHKSPSKQKKSVKKEDTHDDFMESASSVHWTGSTELNPLDDDRFFQIHQSSETPNRVHSNEKENEYIEYLKYAFCVSSLNCGDKTPLEQNAKSDAKIFGKPEYEEILRKVYEIKGEYMNNLNILNGKLLFIKYKYPTNNKPPIDIIIEDLKKTIKRFDGKKRKGGKKSTKKSRTKKARK